MQVMMQACRQQHVQAKPSTTDYYATTTILLWFLFSRPTFPQLIQSIGQSSKSMKRTLSHCWKRVFKGRTPLLFKSESNILRSPINYE